SVIPKVGGIDHGPRGKQPPPQIQRKRGPPPLFLGRPGTILAQLKRELNPELNSTWGAAAEKRITDSDVPRCGERIETSTDLAISSQLEAVEGRVGNECRQERIGEIRMVKNVEKIHTKLHVEALSECSVLVDRKIPLFVRWPAK